jgi:ankyrin repeat protein
MYKKLPARCGQVKKENTSMQKLFFHSFIIFCLLMLPTSTHAESNDPTYDFFHDNKIEIEKASDNPQLLEKYIIARKDINQRFHRGKTLLHYAAHFNYAGYIKVLLKKGADINAVDYDKHTPLHEAISYFSFDAIKILVENGADPNLEDHENETPLAGIVFWPDDKKAVDVLNLFISKGYDLKKLVNAKLIEEAIQRERHDIALILLKNGASFDDAALAATVREGYDDIYTILLEKGANPKQKVTFKDACASGNINIIKSLTSKGIKPSADEIDFCLYNGHKEAAVYLNNKLNEEKKETVDIKRRCHLGPTHSRCQANFLHAYFDSKSCRIFSHGGCDDGGEVPFADLEACKRVCEE